jgi:hypothetical protein
MLISEAEEQARDREAATKAYSEALVLAELEYASLQAAVHRAYDLRFYIRAAYKVLGRDLDDKYKTPQEMSGGTFHMGGRSYGNIRSGAHTGSQPSRQGVQSASRGIPEPKQG